MVNKISIKISKQQKQRVNISTYLQRIRGEVVTADEEMEDSFEVTLVSELQKIRTALQCPYYSHKFSIKMSKPMNRQLLDGAADEEILAIAKALEERYGENAWQEYSAVVYSEDVVKSMERLLREGLPGRKQIMSTRLSGVSV